MPALVLTVAGRAHALTFHVAAVHVRHSVRTPVGLRVATRG